MSIKYHFCFVQGFSYSGELLGAGTGRWGKEGEDDTRQHKFTLKELYPQKLFLLPTNQAFSWH